MPRTARPSPETLQLRVTSPPSDSERTARLATVPLLPWPLAAAAGGAAAAMIGWLLVVGVAGVAWFTASAIPLPDVLLFCSQVWLLAHGAGARIGESTITLMPLGLTVAAAVLAGAVGRFAGGQARLARPGAVAVPERVALAAQVAGLTAAGYAVVGAVMAVTGGGVAAIWPAVAGVFGIALVGAILGALAGLGVGLDDLTGRALAAMVRGGLSGALGLLGVGVVVLGLATFLGAESVATIEQGLALDGAGRLVWAAIALAYLPTTAVWAMSWAAGGGFTVGAGSLVTVSGTKLGMLPAVPLLGALPPVGVAPEATIGWLASGALVGALAGLVAVRQLGTPTRGLRGAATAALVAIGAGVIASCLVMAVAWAGTGALGGLRLVDLGPRLGELALIAPPMLVLSALLAGTLAWTLGAVRAGGGPSVR